MTSIRKFTGAAAAVAFVWAIDPSVTWACEMCWGAAIDNPTTRGISMAMLLLVCMIGCVGGGVGAFFYHVQRRAGLLERSGTVVTEYGDVQNKDEEH